MFVRADVAHASLTDIGCQRDQNEDCFGYFEPESEREFERKGRLLAVADGMGGHAGGQLASELAIGALRDSFLSTTSVDPDEVLVDAFVRAHEAIVAASDSNSELNGMGTTCTAAYVHNGKLSYGHIGDTRLYLVRDGRPWQLTEDHSLVNELRKSGVLTDEQASKHESRNVLTAALGMKSRPVSADFSPEPLDLEEGDVLVLTSDGLHGLVDADEIAEIVSNETPEIACQHLVELAKQRGGPDNITIQVLRLLRHTSATQTSG